MTVDVHVVCVYLKTSLYRTKVYSSMFAFLYICCECDSGCCGCHRNTFSVDCESCFVFLYCVWSLSSCDLCRNGEQHILPAMAEQLTEVAREGFSAGFCESGSVQLEDGVQKFSHFRHIILYTRGAVFTWIPFSTHSQQDALLLPVTKVDWRHSHSRLLVELQHSP